MDELPAAAGSMTVNFPSIMIWSVSLRRAPWRVGFVPVSRSGDREGTGGAGHAGGISAGDGSPTGTHGRPRV